jgi:EpsI family protein
MAESPRPRSESGFKFPGGRPAIILTVALLAQAGMFYGLSRGESVPLPQSLDNFPQQLGPWVMKDQGVMEQEVKDVLRADDYINRSYVDKQNGAYANLFVAFFKSQRQGQAPHSPKNCLPGSGWIWTVSDTIPVTIPGRAEPIRINRYIVTKGDQRGLVLYWYQSRDRVVASEYTAKIFVVADALRYNRTDTALVRVWAPVPENHEKEATEAAVGFVQSFFGVLRQYLPS